MECVYKILLEKVFDLLQSKIDLQQTSDLQIHGICNNCYDEINNIDIVLAGLRDNVKELWQAYREYPIQVNYQDRYARAAYMLSYFPYYINPIYYVLSSGSSNASKDNILDKVKVLNVGFLGGGALPELVGLVKYISKNKKEITDISATVFDSTTHWSTERRLITEPLVKNYYAGKFNIESIVTNLWEKNYSVNDIIKKVDILVLQNTINEATTTGKEILKMNLIKIWNKLPNGAVFIIIDLDYKEISDFITGLYPDLINRKILQELKNTSIRTELPKCYFIQEKLFDASRSEDGLYPRRGDRNYWNIVLQKEG